VGLPRKEATKYNNVTTIEHEFKVIEEWSFTIVCSSSSNPASRYSWFGPFTGEREVLSKRNVRTDKNRNRDDGSWRVLSDDANYLVTLSDDNMQTQLKISQVQHADYADYMAQQRRLINRWKLCNL
ncbi:hypothetical protein DPMN_192762, partial [Dreissena polymorpha]